MKTSSITTLGLLFLLTAARCATLDPNPDMLEREIEEYH
jgi:hypothetical protein